MKELIIIFSLLTTSTHDITEPIYEEPKTCYCTINEVSWTAYCIYQKWSCEKCCEFTKPKDEEDKPKENE